MCVTGGDPPLPNTKRTNENVSKKNTPGKKTVPANSAITRAKGRDAKPNAATEPANETKLARPNQTVYLWVERKQIPHLRVMGRNIRFLKSELEPFRAQFKQEVGNGKTQQV
jgi:excisionase family DNA binding protein